jgi:hypothetical protein
MVVLQAIGGSSDVIQVTASGDRKTLSLCKPALSIIEGF